jgi:hypothetical protein
MQILPIFCLKKTYKYQLHTVIFSLVLSFDSTFVFVLCLNSTFSLNIKWCLSQACSSLRIFVNWYTIHPISYPCIQYIRFQWLFLLEIKITKPMKNITEIICIPFKKVNFLTCSDRLLQLSCFFPQYGISYCWIIGKQIITAVNKQD